MKKMKGFRTLLAYLLAGVMFFSAVPVWAEESAAEAPACETLVRVEDGVAYKYNEKTGTWDPDTELTNLTLNGDLTTDIVLNLFPGDGILLAPALEVTSTEEDTSFTVEGSVTMENEDHNVGDQLTAVEAGGEGLETTLTVIGDIVASADLTAPEPDAEADPSAEPESEPEVRHDTSANGGMCALEVWASDGSEEESEEKGKETLTTVEVQGSVIAEVAAEGEEYAGARADAIQVSSYGEDAKAVVTVGKDATATATATDRNEDGEQDERAEATVIHVDGSGTTEITVKGDAVATAEAPNGNADAKVVESYIYGGETTIHIEGNATAAIVGNDVYEREEEPQGAITVLADNSNGILTVDVDGKIEAKSNVPGDAPIAISASSWGSFLREQIRVATVAPSEEVRVIRCRTSPCPVTSFNAGTLYWRIHARSAATAALLSGR